MQCFLATVDKSSETSCLACFVGVRCCRNICTSQWLLPGCCNPWSYLDSTFRIWEYTPKSFHLGALSIQQPTRDILCLIPALSNLDLNSLSVYWKPRSLWNSGRASGNLETAKPTLLIVLWSQISLPLCTEDLYDHYNPLPNGEVVLYYEFYPSDISLIDYLSPVGKPLPLLF